MKEITGHVIIIGSTVLILTATYLLLQMLIKRLPVWVGKISAPEKALKTKYAIVLSGIWMCTASVILGIDITSSYDAWFFRLMGLWLLWCSPVISYWLCIWLWGRVPLPHFKTPKIPKFSEKIMKKLQWTPHLIAGMCALAALRVFTGSMENSPSILLSLVLNIVTFFSAFIVSFLLFRYVKKHIFRAALVISYIVVMGNADYAAQQEKRESLNWITMTKTQRAACVDYAFIKTVQETFQSLSPEERALMADEYQKVIAVTPSKSSERRWLQMPRLTQEQCTEAASVRLVALATNVASPEEIQNLIESKESENPYSAAAEALARELEKDKRQKPYTGLMQHE